MTDLVEPGTRSTGTSTERALAALEALASLLGEGSVEHSPEVLAQFRDPYRLTGTVVHGPVGVVYPTSTEQVQAVVRTAAEQGVVLQTSSQGRNFGYGGAEPRVDGAIALSLRRMNRVLQIDEELAYAVVEPGVSFAELHEALVAGGHRLMLSSPDLSWGSVLGNALDHGIGYTPRGEHNDNLVGLEVVLADGSVVRTGTGGLPGGAPNWHVHKRGFGPSLDGLFAQSNFGIVTRAGIWLRPVPEAYARLQVSVPRAVDLASLVDTVRPLMLDGTIPSYPSIVHAFCDVAALLPRARWPQLTGFGLEEELAPVVRELGTGMFTLRASLYGREDTLASDLVHVQRAFIAAIPGATISASSYSAPYTRETVAPPHQNGAGLPGLGFLGVYDAWGGKDAAGHIDFSPITPLTGRDALAAYTTLRDGWARHGVQSLYAVITRPRSIAHVNMVMYGLHDAPAITASRAAWDDLHATFAAQGHGVYRAHGDYADAVAATHSFGDHALTRLHDRLKDALDPDGLLSRGKQGIWGTDAPDH